jgi:Uma2 family endonuclease
MATHPHHSYMTVEEYLELDRNSPDVRYEYIDGQVRMMSGGTADHATIAGNIFSILRAALRRTSCRVYNSDMRVRVSETKYVYPDVTVSCDEKDRGQIDILESPTFVVEVLSPGTEGYDRGEKSWYYRAHPTIQEYMIVSAHHPVVEVFRKGKDGLWLLSTLRLNDEVQLASLEVNFPVKEVYEYIVFTEGWTLS